MTPAAEQALRGLLYLCLDAEANGVPLPADLSDRIRLAEREVDRSDAAVSQFPKHPYPTEG